LGGLRGDAPEVLGGDVGAADELLGDLGPVEVEVVVGDERVLALAGLLLETLELLELRLAGLVEQALLGLAGGLDRVDAELALVVELDHRVARGAWSLLVGGEQGVLERVDQGVALDSLLLLDRPDRLDDLSGHSYPSSIRLPRTICSYGISMSSSPL